MSKREGNNGNHGAPGRSGRKPSAVTLLKRRLIENKIDEAEASFAFLVAVRDNESEPTPIRVGAAETILERVLGKARGDDTVRLLGLVTTENAGRELSDDERRARIAELFDIARARGTRPTADSG